MRATSALACDSVTPGFSRASAWKSNITKLTRSSCIGSSTSGLVRRNLKEAGSTPMISPAAPSIPIG